MGTLTVPNANQPVIDPRTGKIDPVWHKFLLELVRLLNTVT